MRKPKSKTAISFEPTDAVARSLTYAQQVSGASIDSLLNESVMQGLTQVVSARARLLKEFNLNNVLGPAPASEPQPSVPPPSAAPPSAPTSLVSAATARSRRNRRSRAASNGEAPVVAPAPAPKRATRPGNRKPGRPKGSKNKPKDGAAAPTTAADPTSL